MMLAVDCSIKGLRKVDVIYIPGMSVIDETPLVDILKRNQPLLNWLVKQASEDSLSAFGT